MLNKKDITYIHEKKQIKNKQKIVSMNTFMCDSQEKSNMFDSFGLHHLFYE